MTCIFLLEDDIPLRNAVARNLEAQGTFDVCPMGTMREAMTLLDQRDPDLLLSDLQLPDGCGLELIGELALRQKHTPVIFITGFFNQYRHEIPETSRLEVIQKPFEPEYLLQRVRFRLSEARHSEVPKSAFTVADYLQLAGMARRSVRLDVANAKGAKGRIVVQQGRPVWAEDTEGKGRDAFARLALLAGGEVICQPCSIWEGDPNLDSSLEQLLLDAARSSDEQARKQPPASRSRVLELRTDEAPLKPPSPATLNPPQAVARRRPSPPIPALKRPALPAIAKTIRKNPNGLQEKKNKMPAESSRNSNLAALVTGTQSVVGLAQADKAGSVLQLAGELDAETACAVATLASRHAEDVASELGFGSVSSWQVSIGDSAWYVVNQMGGLLVGSGGTTKNASSVLSKLDKASRGNQ